MEDHELVPLRRKKALRRNFEVRRQKYSSNKILAGNAKGCEQQLQPRELIIKMFKKRESVNSREKKV